MTWEETIIKVRKDPAFEDLVRLAYVDEDLSLNVERFGQSEEFKETLSILKQFRPEAKSILDIGSGNGISVINFALNGFHVTAVEPDKSDTVGSGAIRSLKLKYELDNVEIFDSYAEEIRFEDASFDIVYVRQAMHHASDLRKFIKECVRVLKPNGLLLTIRDHVVFDQKDKEWFFEMHTLHKYYGGENAYSPEEYRYAIVRAGAVIKKELKYYDSVINYYPNKKEDLEKTIEAYNASLKRHLRKKIGMIVDLPLVLRFYKMIKGISSSNILDEKKVAGRMYSYIAVKK